MPYHNTSVLSININADNTLLNPVFAANINVNTGKAITFGDNVTSNGLLLKGGAPGDNTVAIFPAGFTLNFPITTATSGSGVAVFNGTSTLNKDLGTDTKQLEAAAFVSIAGDNISLNANIHSTVIGFRPSNVSINNSNVTLNGKSEVTDTSFNLNSNILTLTDQLKVANAKTISLITTYNGSSIGQIAFEGVNGEIDASAATQINVTLNDTSTTLPGGGSPLVLPLVLSNAVTGDPNIVKYKLPPNGFLIWSFDVNNLTFTATNNATNAANAILTAQNADQETLDTANKIFNPNNALDALNFAGNLRGVASVDTQAFKKAIDKFKRVQDNSSVVRHVVEETYAVVSQRADTLSAGSIRGISDQNRATVAAGDEQKYSRYGAWGSAFYSHAEQKSKSNLDGYKADSGGGTVGYDTMANDTMTIGLAGTYVRTEAKYKDNLAGDKSKVHSYLFTIYGTQLLCDDYFVTGMASFGSSRVKYTSPRVFFANGAVTSQTAKASYDTMNWGGELIGGYHYKNRENLLLIPSVSLAYNEFAKAGFTEKGTSFQNRSVNQKNNRKLEAGLGLRGIWGAEYNGLLLTPEAHVYVKQALINKAQKTQVTLNGMVDSLYPKTSKSTRTSGNVGTSLTVQSGAMDYSLAYDFNLAKKFTAHTGAIKVRANF